MCVGTDLELSEGFDPLGYNRSMKNPISFRFLVFLKQLKLRRLARLYEVLIGVQLPTVLPKGLILPHPIGVVIHDSSGLGEDCIIYQGVTIGSDKSGFTPTLGSRVTVYAGAVLIGAISLGDDVVVGANAVVTSDVPSGKTIVGNPGRIL